MDTSLAVGEHAAAKVEGILTLPVSLGVGLLNESGEILAVALERVFRGGTPNLDNVKIGRYPHFTKTSTRVPPI